MKIILATIMVSTLAGCAVDPYRLQMIQQALIQGQMQQNANYNWQMQQIYNNRPVQAYTGTRCQSYSVGNRYYTDCN